MTQTVEIFEVGPRDGLQNEARPIPLEDKIALVDTLGRAGLRRIECASFVSPKWVPQMADSAEILAGIKRVPGVAYAALTPNMRGFHDAVAAKADEVAIFASASEGFSKANINATIDESLERFRPVVAEAKAAGLPVRGYVSCVVECPYDGVVPPVDVARVVASLRDMGCYEVSLGDTIGRATPEAIDQMLSVVLEEMPAHRLAGHYHDTNGRACDNIEVSLEHGLRVFDAAVGGLGGCPFAPGAAGNVATEDVMSRVSARGYRHGLDETVIAEASAKASAMRSG